ncbi:hypothetical protein ACQEVI_21520 [Promicromonospora sp. CA-289599]|uniref:hypothetical protein n=1 Tax=Promicromonospora sp. CA-289599 TaxID=3240014 RepID=UPI003D8A2C86
MGGVRRTALAAGERLARVVRTRAGSAVAAVTALVVLATGASALVSTGAADGALSAMGLSDDPVLECPVEEPTMADALATAARCGHEVEALDEKTPWQSYFGQPSGQVRLEVGSSADASDADGDGDFEPIETAVAEDETGRLSPAAPAVAMSFSSGGDDAASEPDVLARMTSADGQVVDVEAPFELTDPVVDGDRIVYPDVLSTGGKPSGVDLVVAVNADGSGFSQVLRIADEKAARNPHVAELDADLGLGVSAQDAAGAGLDVAREHGAFTVTDPHATEPDADGGDPEVFRSSRPLVWTSEVSAEETPAEQAARATAAPARAASFSAAEASPSASTLSGSADPLAGPLTPGAVVELPVDDGDGTEEGVVGAAIESAATEESTAFPMFAALAVSGTLSEVTAIRSAWPDSSSSYQFDGDAGVGRCSAPDPYAGYQCGVTSTHRTLYEFGGLSGVGGLSSSDVTKAVFNINATFSYNCDKTGVWVYQAGGNVVSSSTTWHNPGSWSTRLDTALVTHRSGCDGMVRSVGFDVTAGAKKVASSNWSSLTLGVRSANETTMTGWKRYIGRNDGNGSTSPRATLSVTYNRAPGVPTSLTTWHGKTDFSCRTGTDRPVLRTTTPKLSAFIRDPDGNTTKARFQIWRINSSTQVWGAFMSSYQFSGRTHTIQVPSGRLGHNVVYKWRVLAKDSTGREGSWSKWCEFGVDTSKPNMPTVAVLTSGEGVEAAYQHGEETGGVGLTGKFRLGPNGSTDVVRYAYSFGSQSFDKTAKAQSSGTATISFTPKTSGPLTLWVRSYDRAGNQSDGEREHRIDVAYPESTGLWRFDEGTGTTAYDASGSKVPRNLTLGSGTTWGNGPHTLFGSRAGDRALSLNGVSGQAAAPAVVSSAKSFVVTAHVRLDPGAATDQQHVALSQNGTTNPAFTLGYRTSCAATGNEPCWSMMMYRADTSNLSNVAAQSSTAPVRGQWVHLTGAYDADTDKVSLWVCEIGTPDVPSPAEPVRADSTSTLTTPWASTGSFHVGRRTLAGVPDNFWHGQVDNIRVFDGQVLAENKIRRLCQGADDVDFRGGAPALDPTVKDKSVEEMNQ